MINIEPKHIEQFNCLYDCMYTVLYSYKRDYRMTFCDEWNFRYNPNEINYNELVGTRIDRSRNIERYEKLFYEYCGFTGNYNKYHSIDMFIEKIKEQIMENKAVIIRIDSYWCPSYRINYLKTHHEHYILVVDIDDENNFKVYDPNMGSDMSIIDYHHIENGSDLSFLKYSIIESPKDINYRKVLEDSVERIGKSNMFSNMMRFLEEFEDNFNFEAEYKEFEKNIWNVNFDRNIRFISSNRALYAEFLEATQENELIYGVDMISNMLKEASKKWDLVRIMMSKCVYAGFNATNHMKIGNIIKEVIEFEKNIFSELLEVVGN